MPPYNPQTESDFEAGTWQPENIDEAGEASKIRVKTAFNENVFITYIDQDISLTEFRDQMNDVCGLPSKVTAVKQCRYVAAMCYILFSVS